MPYQVVNAGDDEVNGTYYRDSLQPPTYSMWKNDRKYVIHLSIADKKWCISRADLAIYVPMYEIPNPRIEEIPDTFREREKAHAERMKSKTPQRRPPKKVLMRNKSLYISHQADQLVDPHQDRELIPPPWNGWRPIKRRQRHKYNKIIYKMDKSPTDIKDRNSNNNNNEQKANNSSKDDSKLYLGDEYHGWPGPIIIPFEEYSRMKIILDNNPRWLTTTLRVQNAEKAANFYVERFGMHLLHKELNMDIEQMDDDLYDISTKPNNKKCMTYYLCTQNNNNDYYEDNEGTDEERNRMLHSYDGGVLALTQYQNRISHKIGGYGKNKLMSDMKYDEEEDVDEYISALNTNADDDEYLYDCGNNLQKLGFGHIGFNCNGIDEVYQKLKNSTSFIVPPGMGKIEATCFAIDVDGYWIEIIGRNPRKRKKFLLRTNFKFPALNFSQAMIRIKHPMRSMQFYCDILGMTCIREFHLGHWKFSLYSLAYIPKSDGQKNKNSYQMMRYPDSTSEYSAMNYSLSQFHPSIELAHTHGHELEEDVSFYSGNEHPKGFAHFGFLVDNVQSVFEAISKLEYIHVPVVYAPEDARNAETAMVRDPDGYYIKLIQRSP